MQIQIKLLQVKHCGPLEDVEIDFEDMHDFLNNPQPVRNHAAFLNGYFDEDDGLYDDFGETLK